MNRQSTLRRPGRPPGTIKRLTPKGRIRLRLETETIALMEKYAAASGLELGLWLDFTIADLKSKGQLLNERRERDLKLRECNRFMNATAALMGSTSVEHFIELARKTTRPLPPLP